jgi:hypothetical protein
VRRWPGGNNQLRGRGLWEKVHALADLKGGFGPQKPMDWRAAGVSRLVDASIFELRTSNVGH